MLVVLCCVGFVVFKKCKGFRMFSPPFLGILKFYENKCCYCCSVFVVMMLLFCCFGCAFLLFKNCGFSYFYWQPKPLRGGEGGERRGEGDMVKEEGVH